MRADDLHRSHYENFPVASLLLPKALREPVAAIYAFARSADDFADEGDLSPTSRLELLEGYRRELDAIDRNEPTTHPLFLRLRRAISGWRLPTAPFRDLLDAFAQDVMKTRYATFAELEDYCRRSANPVGRLLLRLFGAETPENLRASDAVCSALQLTNHWQDVGIDIAKPVPRLYLPLEDLARFGVREEDIARRVTTAEFRRLMRFEVDRARALMLEGAPLGRRLRGRIGMEIRLVVAGGLRILDKIEAANYDVFSRRPVLAAGDWLRMLRCAL